MSILAPLLRLAGRGFLPGGKAARLSILMYHDVLDQADPLRPWTSTVESFTHDMNMLSRCFNVLSLDDALTRLDQGTLPPRSVVITFDDGYATSARNAVPVLRKFGFHATWYLVPGLLNGGRMWNDSAIEAIRHLPEGEVDLRDFALGIRHVDSVRSRKVLAGDVESAFFGSPRSDQQAIANRLMEQSTQPIPDDLMMTTQEVLDLDASGMGIGSHTGSHPVLSRVDDAEAEQEMDAGKVGLEEILGRDVTHFAYPVGRPGKDFSGIHADIAERLGMASAVTTGWGVSTKETDRFQLARFTPWDRSFLRYTLRMFRNGRVKPDIQARGS